MPRGKLWPKHKSNAILVFLHLTDGLRLVLLMNYHYLHRRRLPKISEGAEAGLVLGNPLTGMEIFGPRRKSYEKTRDFRGGGTAPQRKFQRGQPLWKQKTVKFTNFSELSCCFTQGILFVHLFDFLFSFSNLNIFSWESCLMRSKADLL